VALLSNRLRYGLNGLAVLLVVVAFGFGPVQAQPPAVPEYDVKAAFVYNFAKFAEWPEAAFRDPQTPLSVCIIGRGPAERSFEAIRDKQIKRRDVIVLANDEIRSVRACHILFLAGTDRRRTVQILESLKGAPVLTIGETSEFSEQDGVITFLSVDNKVRFEINQNAAKRAGLAISSQLLRMADKIKGQER
jgi:hypothetical protein